MLRFVVLDPYATPSLLTVKVISPEAVEAMIAEISMLRNVG